MDMSVWEKQKDGVRRTKKLYDDGHNHPAAKAAWEFEVKNFNPASCGFSNWFLPTAGQVIMAVKGLGGKAEFDDEDKDWECNLSMDLDKELKDVGIKSFDITFDCWTSTEYDKVDAIFVTYSGGGFVRITPYTKNDQGNVRPFIAF